MARVLGVVRLSREKEESTSVERQRAVITDWCAQNGHTLAGWAEDVGVSGGVAPWDRPELGQWLPSTIGKDATGPAQRKAMAATRASEFDIICVWRLDRLTRRLLHLSGLIEWATKNGKGLVSTSEGFDILSPLGKVLAGILGVLAEGELESIKSRAKESFDHLMRVGRWRGGFVPYGYVAVKAETGEGWFLEPDEGTAGIIREIIRRIVDEGESSNAVVRWLNASGIPTPLDAQRARKKKLEGTPERPTCEWRVANLLRVLRSSALLGHAELTEKGEDKDGKPTSVTRVVRGADGMPVQRAKPLLSREDYDRLQATLDGNSTRKTGNRVNGSLLLRVAFCECGEPLYKVRGRNNMYYRCGMRGRSSRTCPTNPSIRMDLLEQTVTETFLAMVGGIEVVRQVFVPGNDQAADLAAVDRALEEARADRMAGLYSSTRGAQDYLAMYGALEARREAIGALPARGDLYRAEPTGETYQGRWERTTTEAERAAFLRESGIRVILHKKNVHTPPLFDIDGDAEGYAGGRVHFEIPSNLKERLASTLGEAE